MFKFLKRRSVEQRQATSSLYVQNISALQDTQLTPISALQAESVIPPLCACVDLIANTIASTPLHVVRFQEESRRQIVPDHMLMDVFRSPAPHLTGISELLRIVMRSLLLFGNSVIVIDGEDGEVTLDPIPWPYCGIVNLSEERLTYQISRPYRGKARLYQANRIIHLKINSDDGGIYGRSPLQRAGASFALVQQVERSTFSLWSAGIYPSLALQTNKTLSPQAKKQAREDLQKEFAGDKMGRALLFDQDLKPTPININSEHLQHVEQRLHGGVSVAQIYSCPPQLIGDSRYSTYSNMQEAMRILHEITLKPYFILIEQAITQRLLSDEPELIVEFDTTSMRVSRTERVQNVALLVKEKVITAEQGAKELGYG